MSALERLGVQLTPEQTAFAELEQYEISDSDLNPPRRTVDDDREDIFRNKKVLDLGSLSFMQGVSLTEELRFPDFVSVADCDRTYAQSTTADLQEDAKNEQQLDA